MSERFWVLRLQSDKSDSPILLKVSPKRGGHELDLDLVATDGDAAYAVKLRQRHLKKLRGQAYDGSDDDWAAILSYGFKVQEPSQIHIGEKNSLEITCSIGGKDPQGTLSINFRNKVEDITQQLGSVELHQTEDTDDVDLFGWTLRTIEQRDEAASALTSSTAHAKAKAEVASSLQQQVDELVKAKAEHETQLLLRFSALLNEKKLKIRKLQRILSTAQTDPKKVEEAQSLLGTDRSTEGARKNKRRADKTIEYDQADESDGFEGMQIDPPAKGEEDTASPSTRATTPSSTDSGGDGGVEQPAPDRPRTRAMDSKKASGTSPGGLPPKRDLPFQKAATCASTETKDGSTRATVDDDDDEETASEASEL